MTKLTKIEKPNISDFGESRKLFCIPLIPQFNQKDLAEGLKNNIKEFWIQVASKIEDLKRIGKVSFVFVESVAKDGEQGLDMTKQLSEECYMIVKEKIEKGAKLVAVENEEIFNEFFPF